MIQPSPRSAGEVRWGILATGGTAHTFTRDLVLHGHQVSAVGSRTPGSAAGFAEEHGIPRAHGSYEDLVSDPTVDVVYVATPHNLHAANAMLALEHGKHVLVEKAFTQNAQQARDVVELARQRGLVAVEAMWTRFLPHMAWVRSAIDDGRLGMVRSLHADHTQALPRDDSHRLNDPRLAGGALLDLGVYPVSFAHDILGRPLDVRATATFKPTGVDASVATVFRHADDVVSTTYSSMETRGRNSATILGTEARLEIAATWYGPATVSLVDPSDHVVDRFELPVSGRGMQYQAAEVERLLADDGIESPLMTHEGSVDVMQTLDDVRRAIDLRYPDE